MSKKNFDKRAIYFPLGCRKFIRRLPIERDKTKRSLVTTDVAHIKTQVVNIEHKQEYVTDICTLNMNSRRRSKISSNESIYNWTLFIIHLLTWLRATSWVMLDPWTEIKLVHWIHHVDRAVQHRDFNGPAVVIVELLFSIFWPRERASLTRLDKLRTLSFKQKENPTTKTKQKRRALTNNL